MGAENAVYHIHEQKLLLEVLEVLEVLSVLSLFAEIFQVTGFADTARVQASLCVRTFGSHLLPTVEVVALLAETAGVELPIRMGTTSRKLWFLRLVNPAVCLLDFTRGDDWLYLA